MKKILLSSLLALSMVSVTFAQGTIFADNSANSNTSVSALANGLFFIDNGGGPVLATAPQLHITVTGGPSSGNQTVFINNLILDNVGLGQYIDFNSETYNVPNVALSGVATLQIFAWTGSATSYNDALIRGVSTFFTNPTGGGGTPAATPTTFSGMPAIVLTPVPEPSTFALAGLGLASLLIFRRRK